jgi:hypothetical protein
MFTTYKDYCRDRNEKSLSIKTFVRIMRTEYPEYTISSAKREIKPRLCESIKKEEKDDNEIIINEIVVYNTEDQLITEEMQDSDDYYDEDIIEEDADIKDHTVYEPDTYNEAEYTTFEVQVLPITSVTEHNDQQIFF